MSKLRTAIFGGSFNPIHNGHLKMAQYVINQLEFDKFVFLPAYLAPHKREDSYLSFRHRVTLLKLAIESQLQPQNMVISVLEKAMPLPNYSYLTLRELQKRCENAELSFVLGYDMFAYLPKWKNTKEILSTYSLVIFNRNNAAIDSTYDELREKYLFHAPPTFVYDFDMGVSSTEIRQSLTKYYIDTKKNTKNAEFIEQELRTKLSFSLPETVIEYIIKQKLFS